MIHTNNIGWWSIILTNFLGYFVFRFGSSKDGLLSSLAEVIGGLLIILSIITMVFFEGVKETIALVVIFMFPITLFFANHYFSRESWSKGKRTMLKEI